MGLFHWFFVWTARRAFKHVDQDNNGRLDPVEVTLAPTRSPDCLGEPWWKFNALAGAVHVIAHRLSTCRAAQGPTAFQTPTLLKPKRSVLLKRQVDGGGAAAHRRFLLCWCHGIW